MTRVLFLTRDSARSSIIQGHFEKACELQYFSSGKAMLDFLRNHGGADLIVVDVLENDATQEAYALCATLKEDVLTRAIPVVFLGNAPQDEERALMLGASDFITGPIDSLRVKTRIAAQLALGRCQRQVLEQTEDIVIRMMQAFRSHYWQPAPESQWSLDNYERSIRDGVALLALKLGLSEAEARLIGVAATLRDIGKMSLPHEVLAKVTALTAEEWRVLQTHPEMGARMLEGGNSRLTEMGRTIALTHHERWDGSGFPRGLSGEMIPLPGRIVAVVDTFWAMTSPKRLHPAIPDEEALAMLREKSGVHFDPKVAEAFLESRQEFLAILDHARNVQTKDEGTP